jgi:SnoaL-like domain
MTDIEEIRNLLGPYCLLIDDGEFDKFEDLLAPDAVLDAMGELVVGRSQIRSFLEENYPARRVGATSRSTLSSRSTGPSARPDQTSSPCARPPRDR